MREHLVAVDVGTGSARAAIFDKCGTLLAKASFPIAMHLPMANHAEHDSEDIWRAITAAVRQALELSQIKADRIAAIGFDATCSLVVRGPSDTPLSISTSGNPRFDTIMWLDHRAMEEAAQISASNHPLVDYSGGRISPEMEIPKLMWLKRHLPATWEKACGIFDLADYITFRATGSTARSCSTLAAKWTFLAHEKPGWQQDFLSLAGLEDLSERAQLPEIASEIGTPIGTLSPQAAEELGLDEGCVVAPGMIDAYAGALGLLGEYAPDPSKLEQQVALIAGTSSCIIKLAREAEPQRGYWGPYLGVGLPGFWLIEGGQSAAGALLDHIVRMHAAGGTPDARRHSAIIDRIGALQEIEGDNFGLPINVLADFHGNRSPIGDPGLTGTISGLTLDCSFDGLCRLYWRTAVGIACGIRHILERLHPQSPSTDPVHIAGGHARNPLLVALYADMTGRRIIVPSMPETVLLGTAMNAATAAGLYPTVCDAGVAMASRTGEQMPDPHRRAAYDRDYARYLAMIRHREELLALD